MRARKAGSSPRGADQSHRLRRWWLDRSLRSKGLIVVAVPLIALLGITSANLVLQQVESNERSVAVNAHDFDDAAAQVLADAVNGETGVRGYAATDDPTFLGPYTLMLTRMGAERTLLRKDAVTVGLGRQEQAVDVTTGQELAELAQLRSAISYGGAGANLQTALLAGKTTMDRLRGQVAALIAGPTALVTTEHNDLTTLQTRIQLFDVAGLVLGLLAGLGGVALFASGIVSRVGMNVANAGRLGEGLPLEPVAYAGDEIGRLAESHLRAEGLLARRTRELTAARDTAMRATQVKNSFLSSTSHELRTPLNSILGFAQLLQLSELSAEDNDGVDRILGAGRHLLALINELIDIARIESGDLGLSLEPVLVRPVIEETCQLMAPIAAERSIRISTDCVHPALTAFVDRQRLAQVLVNLISNAVKYNHRNGSITVSCRQEGPDQVSIVVSDTGPGLAADDLERIFLPFERLGAERTAVEGTGIGLPLAKALTEAMRGQLTVASVLGQGAAFTVSLNRAPDLVQIPRPSPAGGSLGAGPDTPEGAGLSILCIEDNPANVEVVARYLKGRPGTRLVSAISGRVGIASAVRDVPDIILLDLHLPDLQGDEVLNELKADPVTAAIPVIVLSADASRGVIRRLLAGGAYAYLTKPIELAELGGLIDTLDAARAQKQQKQQPQPAIGIAPA
jgi:signal transduction histidine kinase/ActR/RegA family two-component response regulator